MLNCPLCEKVFRRREHLNTHLISHTKEKPYKCSTCSAVFGLPVSLKKHIQVVHQGVKTKTWTREKNLQCSLCSFRCTYRQALDIHFRKHSAERPFPCKIPGCDFKAKYKANLLQHFQNKHNVERPHECTSEGCNYKTHCPSNLRRHLKIHSNEKPFVCKQQGCNFTSKYESSLKDHFYRRHSEEKRFMCTICDFRTKYKRSLRQHQDEHENIKRYRCRAPKCSFSTSCRNSLRVHFARKHTKKDMACTTPGCKFRCGTNFLLKEHVHRRHAPPISKCPVESCYFSTRVLHELRLHLSRQHKDLQSAALLLAGRSDQQTAGSMNALICAFPNCDFQTEFQHRYDRHIKTHDKEKRKHSCKFCSYRSTTCSSLQSHIQRRHLGEKSSSCSLCNYTTACSRQLRMHAGTIHHVHVIPRGKVDYLVRRCNPCSRKFPSYSEFVLHSMTHLKAFVVLQRLRINVM